MASAEWPCWEGGHQKTARGCALIRESLPDYFSVLVKLRLIDFIWLGKFPCRPDGLLTSLHFVISLSLGFLVHADPQFTPLRA